ncbi:hypothetical protein AT5G60030 [Arabidopsis thaliana]|uniref:Uncharacterized protein n=1 Tax=Arabidopsis thaliana TaxID=3702 RepID=A0A1P8BGJ5_ARATH|nr:uncharacterized protein AT5G60030 [Arabidopsis thaliana]ANM70728.1 hypothetical protein AT5G60030 [Arabidopsis thaliana]|eukprot:NP_001332313.1 hypothetical protein AT5G60030 [Arabidopsis thaliana]
MKTVTGRVVSAEPISLSKAAKLLSGFASSDNGASQDVSAYLRRASAAFTELKSFHREIKSKETKPSSDRETKSTETKQSSDAKSERNVIDEFDGRKIRYRNSEAVSVESVYGRERDEKKMKKSKDADVVDEKVNEKLEAEQRSEERRERKKEKKKKKNNKDEDVVDEKEKEKLEDEQRSGERKKEKKKKRKSDEEIVSEERKSKKKRKSDEEMGSEERKSKKKRKLKEIDD